MMAHGDVPPEIASRLRSICLGLPEAYEEEAWVGTRWRIRRRTFAHVLLIDAGWPPAYARAAETDGPAIVLMFRSSGEELEALRRSGDRFFGPPWRADEVGLVLESAAPAPAARPVDWQEVDELITDSYCFVAPGHLAALVERPPAP